MDYGVSRAEQWRRRRAAAAASIIQRASNGEEEETASLALKKVDAAESNRAGEVPLIAASCIGPGGGTKGYFCKVPLR